MNSQCGIGEEDVCVERDGEDEGGIILDYLNIHTDSNRYNERHNFNNKTRMRPISAIKAELRHKEPQLLLGPSLEFTSLSYASEAALINHNNAVLFSGLPRWLSDHELRSQLSRECGRIYLVRHVEDSNTQQYTGNSVVVFSDVAEAERFKKGENKLYWSCSQGLYQLELYSRDQLVDVYHITPHVWSVIALIPSYTHTDTHTHTHTQSRISSWRHTHTHE
eukprot:GHVR01157008.1.p1 GENE.GHVR01157008.1~~GHVR01157008.1.p1  ORF type:complete len:231 (-),score=88.48 GHVR01157008.1:37-699(-)